MLKIIVILHTLVLSSFCSIQAKPLVAITKIAPHPSLEAIEKGIKDGLKEAGIDAGYQLDNAQGNISTAVQIAKKYGALKPDVIIPISTPSAQTVYQVALSEKIPVVFAAVSDPVAAKLIDAETKKGKNLTGVSDLSPISEQIRLIQILQPSAQKIGILYNPGEANSVALLDLFKLQATAKGLEIKLFPCLSSVDLRAVSQKIKGNVDAVYIPNDNTIISGLNVVVKILDDLPIYAADPESVYRGCLASAALSQYDIGVETGKLAARVLKGENPSTVPVVHATVAYVTLNQRVAHKLKIDFPQSLKKNAIIIGD
ncbi:MAG: ABC transporter substrate-binding protein [Candidatus Paracaedibacteraceae bacterium]|nr:ABC transporter substrate-binding protein [Candidatus Paracaedibacteraceae bacterium]